MVTGRLVAPFSCQPCWTRLGFCSLRPPIPPAPARSRPFQAAQDGTITVGSAIVAISQIASATPTVHVNSRRPQSIQPIGPALPLTSHSCAQLDLRRPTAWAVDSGESGRQLSWVPTNGGHMKFSLLVITVVLVVMTPLAVSADSLYGRCIGRGGNKCQTHHRISTSWNGKTGHINSSSGTYSLDLGGKVGKTITVYCDGNSVGTVNVRGRTEFTVRCR